MVEVDFLEVAGVDACEVAEVEDDLLDTAETFAAAIDEGGEAFLGIGQVDFFGECLELGEEFGVVLGEEGFSAGGRGRGSG